MRQRPVRIDPTLGGEGVVPIDGRVLDWVELDREAFRLRRPSRGAGDAFAGEPEGVVCPPRAVGIAAEGVDRSQTAKRVARPVELSHGLDDVACLSLPDDEEAMRIHSVEAVEPHALCQQVNRILCGNIAEGRFISFFYCVLDAATGLLSYSNAGHYLPILVRADGTHERLDVGGPVLGILPDAEYEQATVALNAGDRVVLFTDGLTEARNADDEEFGEPRLIDVAIEHRCCSAPAMQARLSDAVATSCGGRLQDDATLIVLASDLG